MSPADVLTILLAAKAVDDRVTPDQAKAAAWSAILIPSMTLEAARTALIAHYRTATTAIMPADLNSAWQAMSRRQAEDDALQQRDANATNAVPMPPEVREQITRFARQLGRMT